MIVADALSAAEGNWLLLGLGVLAFLAVLVNHVLGAVQKMKQLRNGTVSPTPLPVIVEKSLAEKFVDVPRFKEFTEYVHNAHHTIRNEIQQVELEGEKRGDETKDLIKETNKANERRFEGVHVRMNAIAEEMPQKVIQILRDTGHLRWPGRKDI
jgi:hypothetical protein